MSKMTNWLRRGLRYRWLLYTRQLPSRDLRYCRTVRGHLNLEEGVYLHDAARRLPAGVVIVEIGSYLGRSTCYIASALKGKQATFYAVDTWENQGMSEGEWDTLDTFRQNTAPYREAIVEKRGFSYDVVLEMQDVAIDLLWIDGCHEYEAVKRDIADWLPLVKTDGLVCFDDYYRASKGHRVTRAVDEAIAAGWLAPVKHVGDRMFVGKKLGG